MSASAQAIEIPEASKSVTKISANARIDYILRFSKQAILVVDEQLEHCSTVGNQFLSNLPAHHNAAFVSISAKLNDIQVRCRLIEQLFHNEFFDPEQSIAVSLINLAKHKKQAISIVVDNAHLLSLQLIHELCQLADIAKKADYQITVLMLGSPQTGTIVANNRELFHKKLSILSAQTGQLLSINAKVFKAKHDVFNWTTKKKLLAVLAVLSLTLLGALTLVLKTEPVSFSGLTASDSDINNSNDVTIANAKLPLFTQGDDNQILEPVDIQVGDLVAPDKSINQASVADILRSLQGPLGTKVNKVQEPLLALPADILKALEKNEHEQAQLNNPPSNTVNQLIPVNDFPRLTNNPVTPPSQLNKALSISSQSPLLSFDQSNPEYYLQFNQGFVVQIAVFSQPSAFQTFIIEHPSNQFYSYLKQLNNTPVLLVTSKVYATRAEAAQAITYLPEKIIEKQPWIKAISSVNSEIKSFQRSQ
jgi:DamX protein